MNTIIENNLEKVFEKIKNIHPDKKKEIYEEIENNDDFSNANLGKISTFVKNYLNLNNSVNRNTKEYWKKRGWSDIEIFGILEKNRKNKPKRLSPFSKEFWIQKGYSEEEAEYKRNSIRPIRKEYWMERGYKENDAIEKAKETKRNNDLKGNKVAMDMYYSGERDIITNTRIDYWIHKGYSEEEANILLKQRQATFTKEKCIEKYGEDGLQIWSDRQEKWQKSLNENGNLDNKKKSNLTYDFFIRKFDGDIFAYCEYINKSRKNICLVSTKNELIEKINQILKNKPYLQYSSMEIITKIIQKIQYDILGIVDIESFFKNNFDLRFGEAYQLPYGTFAQKTDKGLLRSSYEIEFHNLLIKYDIDNYIIDHRYPDSNFRYDFYFPDVDVYVEICPNFHWDERVQKKMKIKQKLFNSVLLKNIDEFKEFVIDLKRKIDNESNNQTNN